MGIIILMKIFIRYFSILIGIMDISPPAHIIHNNFIFLSKNCLQIIIYVI